VENSDNIRVVVEQNKIIGGKLTQCAACSRLFSLAKLEKYDELRMVCVFCRLENRKPEQSQTTLDGNSARTTNQQEAED
jgi:hypothetical protein